VRRSLPGALGAGGAPARGLGAFKAAISERWIVEDFLREAVSRRISLREIREISSFITDAIFDMSGSEAKGEDLKSVAN
jgi:hypothetical protein